ncbi:phosphoribosylglycinamide formyltransferase [Desulforhopalus vacuolatus]|uniref:formyltransferase family protein n=1 Tax=Desulforhopalus vacuolatus TaxID=40414 RepID=UPI001965B78E|nr:formyltransferase family protein [Desulforhopalus vacuolatus]MBM9520491.1 phosphoribosylglycinamide formyltransferase [Desulforhopalus vacuolatus]
MLKIAVLLSGSGRTLDNFHQYIEKQNLDCHIEVVISNVADVLGLKKARDYGYPSFYAGDNESINNILADFKVDVICLAGFMKLYHPPVEMKRAVINIHPSLIPSFCGAGFYGHHVHEAVRAKGCMVSGCTVHFANDYFDDGPIIWQQAVQLDWDDDAESIAAKVFAAECEAFPRALQLINDRGTEFFWRRVGL